MRLNDSAFGWLRIADDIEADFELIAQSRKNFPSKRSYLTEHQCHFVVFETRKHDGSDREHVIAGLCYLLTKKSEKNVKNADRNEIRTKWVKRFQVAASEPSRRCVINDF